MLEFLSQSGINYGVIVYFSNGQDVRCKFLKDGFRHCGVVIMGKNNLCCIIEATFGGLFVHTLCHTKDDRKVIEKYFKEGGWKYAVLTEANQFNERFNTTILTCVTLIKQLLGVRNWWVQTPHQLYKYLLNNGAEEIKNPLDNRSHIS